MVEGHGICFGITWVLRKNEHAGRYIIVPEKSSLLYYSEVATGPQSCEE